jgi:hypothetical protein
MGVLRRVLVVYLRVLIIFRNVGHFLAKIGRNLDVVDLK